MKRTLLLSILFLASVCVAHGASIRDEGIIADSSAEAYAGSARCGECHAEQYERWSKTLMARFVRYRKDMDSLPGNWGKSPLKKSDVFLVVGLNRKVAFVRPDWIVFPAEYHLDNQKWIKKKRGCTR